MSSEPITLEQAKAAQKMRFDLNWQLTNLDFSLVTRVHGFIGGSALRCIGRFLWGTARALYYSCKCGPPKPGSVAFFVSSNNQFNAISTVTKKLKYACVVEMVKPSNNCAHVLFPLHKAYFRAIPNVISLIWNFQKHSEFHKSVIKSRGDLIALAPSLQSVAYTYLEKSNPAVVVVSNDTVLWARAVLSAAHDLKIPTVLLQHAPVSKLVPSLEVDYAFLDGQDAADKYQQAGIASRCNIYLSGGPRHDQLTSHLNQLDTIRSEHKRQSFVFGICTNPVDEYDQVARLLKQVSEHPSSSVIILRCHPQERRKSEFKKLADSLGIKYSSNNSECPKQFIDRVDIVIAGDSSMLLDAVLSCKIAIKSDLLGVYDDYLDLVKNGIVQRAKNRSELYKYFETTNKSSIPKPEMLKKYCATIYSPWQGQSSKLVVDALADIASGESPDCLVWQASIDHRTYTVNNENKV